MNEPAAAVVILLQFQKVSVIINLAKMAGFSG